MAKTIRGLELESEAGCAPLKSMKQKNPCKREEGLTESACKQATSPVESWPD